MTSDGLHEVEPLTGHIYGLLQGPPLASEYEDPKGALKENESGDLGYCFVEGKRSVSNHRVMFTA